MEGDDVALVEEDLPDESADYFEDYDEPGDSPTSTLGVGACTFPLQRAISFQNGHQLRANDCQNCGLWVR